MITTEIIYESVMKNLINHEANIYDISFEEANSMVMSNPEYYAPRIVYTILAGRAIIEIMGLIMND